MDHLDIKGFNIKIDKLQKANSRKKHVMFTEEVTKFWFNFSISLEFYWFNIFNIVKGDVSVHFGTTYSFTIEKIEIEVFAQ